MAFPGFRRETRYPGIVAGVDEAGRGPLAGPVVAACVILNRTIKSNGINDSKQVSRERREILFDHIMNTAVVGVGMCSVDEIDTHNILGATKLAMLRAYEAMPSKPDIALIDGNQLPGLPCRMDAVVDGDALCISIAAASLIAKVTRDRMMTELAREFPYYGWHSNMGYGTAAHCEGMKRHGVTVHHRRSFAPVRRILEQGVIPVLADAV